MPEQGTSFGARLRSLRQTAGLTQEELASRAGLSPNALSSLERGKRRRPQPHTIRSLADALNLSEEEGASLIAVVPRQEPRRGATVPEISTPGSGVTLPSHPTPLLGREQELADIRELLLGSSRVRLLTLTGIGGVGKTRLAMEVARASLADDHFPDGVDFVGLASLRDPTLVIPTVARSLGLTEDHGQSASDALRTHLLAKRLLLVLDNFEHLLDAASKVISLIEACPHLVVLATSRAPLRVRAEYDYSVPPLSLPSSTRNPTEKEILRTSSGRLFVERARAVSPSFALTTENAGAVAASCCWRLAGLPLALELAAAKVRFLDPTALLSRLDRALSTAWARDLSERQRTMRATLDWSYDLLSEPEQALFRRLSVFVGGFSLEAAEATGEPEEVLDLLGALVEQSLVQKWSREVDGEASYGMLEPVRQYARERLEAEGEVEETSHLHATFFLGLAEWASSRIWGPEQGEWFDTLEEENGNLRAAMTWALEQDQMDIAGRFCWALWLFWWARGHHQEGRHLSEATLDGRLSPGVRTRVLPVAASMVYVQGEYDSAEKHWLEGALLSRQVGDVIGEGYSTVGTGLAQMVRGAFEAAVSMQEALPLLKRPEGEDALASLVHVWLGTTQLVQGDMAGAEREIEAGLGSARNRKDPLCTYVALYNLAQLALAREDLTFASSALREGIELSGQTKDQANLAHFLEALSAVAALGGALESSTILLGAAEISLQEVGVPVYNFYNPDPSLRERVVEATRAGLGEKTLKRAGERGRSMTFEEAVGYALEFDLFHNDSAS